MVEEDSLASWMYSRRIRQERLRKSMEYLGVIISQAE
jgi:hypothetical protein